MPFLLKRKIVAMVSHKITVNTREEWVEIEGALNRKFDFTPAGRDNHKPNAFYGSGHNANGSARGNTGNPWVWHSTATRHRPIIKALSRHYHRGVCRDRYSVVAGYARLPSAV